MAAPSPSPKRKILPAVLMTAAALSLLVLVGVLIWKNSTTGQEEQEGILLQAASASSEDDTGNAANPASSFHGAQGVSDKLALSADQEGKTPAEAEDQSASSPDPAREGTGNSSPDAEGKGTSASGSAGSLTPIPDPQANELGLALAEDPHINPQFTGQEVESRAFLVVDRETGRILAQKNPDVPLEPASLTKIMTAFITLAHYDNLTEELVVEEEDLAELIDLGASVAGFPEGAHVSIEDLLYGVLLPSGADACHVLARSIAGSREAFVQEMNETAMDLGMENSFFTNPTGLPDPAMLSTARDMALLFYKACQNPTFVEISGTNAYEIPDFYADGTALSFTSTFLWKFHSSPDFRDQVLAGKSGFSGTAQCQASLIRKGGRDYLLVTLGAPTEDPASHQAVEDHIVLANELLVA